MTQGINEILSRLKDHLRSHAVDYENELLSYDYKKNGIISTVSFHRWISSTGMYLSSRAIQAIIIAFQLQDGVDVRKLIDAIKNSNSFSATLSAKAPTCTAELADLARELARRRQNVREALEPFDRMNSGHVLVNNFYRCFGQSPSTKAVADFYQVDGSIDYLRLGNDLKTVSKNIDTSKYTLPEVTPAFASLATFIKSREIDANLVFSRNDRLNTGKLPRRQFCSVISSFGSMISPSGVMEIADSFSESGDMCNYNLFIQALDKFVPPPPKATTKKFEIPDELRRAVDPKDLLQSVRARIAQRRIDVENHFLVADREFPGQNVISPNLFDRLVGGLHIDLNHDEIETIAGLFRSETGGIKYKDFVDAVKIQITTREITSNDVLPRLRSHLESTNQKLYPSAARFDREGSGNISVQQLISALQFVRFEISNPEVAVLRDTFPGSERGTVDWISLCKECDPNIPDRATLQAQAAQNELNAQQTREEKYNPPPRNVASIVSNIANAAESQHIDLIIEFRNKDSMKRGTIPQQTFTSFLYTLPIQISPTDLRTLISYYRVSGSSDINYIAFATDSKRIFETEETAKIEAARRTALEPRVEPIPEMPLNVHNFIKRFKTFAQQMRINPIDVFQPYDVNHNGTIPIYNVQACFNNFNFQSTREEVHQLVEIFRDKRKPELFNYNIFARAVKEEDISSPDVRATLASAPLSGEIERNAMITCSQIREKLLARHRRIEAAFSGINTDTIPTQEFQRRLYSFDIVLTASQVQSLLRKYRMNLTDEINYNQFITDVNNSKTI